MVGSGLLMVGVALLLSAYMLLSRRTRYLPTLPLGWLILYVTIRAIDQFAGHLPMVSEYQKWVGVGYSVVLSWAVVRLTFALLLELPLKKWKAIEIPHITRDFILLVCYAVLFLVVLRTRGDVNLAGLITTSAALTVVIGLAAQTTLGNFFSGLVLQMEHPFSIGDWITYNSHTGRVTGITWKSTRIVTRDNVLIYLPNNELSNGILINYTKPDRRMVGRLNIGLDYNAPPYKVREVIFGILMQHPKVLNSPRPQIRLIDFDDSSINYEVRFWYNNYLHHPQIKADLNDQLWYALRRNKINIPFPIRDTRLAHIERHHKCEARQQLSEKILDMLENVPLFEALTDEDRQTIAEEATIQDYGSGEPIVHQNEPGDSLYIILSGACGVLLEKEGGRTQKVATIKKGDFFGEMSLLTGEARKATVKAMEHATVARVDKALFSKFLASNPQICEKLGTAMAQRQLDLDKEANRPPDELANPKNVITRIKAFFRI
jgi:small-conductance mechanosensitive channel/CRP-like cAMP-binding protein